MGAKLRAGLPKESGLTPELADKLAANPTQVVVIALLDVADVVSHVKADSETTIFEIISIEAADGAAGDALREQLRKLQEGRTGERALWNDDGSPAGYATGDPKELARQVELLRAEEAAKLQERADQADDSEERVLLEDQAKAIREGARDTEWKERVIATMPQFSDGSDD